MLACQVRRTNRRNVLREHRLAIEESLDALKNLAVRPGKELRDVARVDGVGVSADRIDAPTCRLGRHGFVGWRPSPIF